MIQIKKKQKFGEEGKVFNGKWGSNCLLNENADKTICLTCNRNISIMTEYMRHLYQSRKEQGK
jgi:hypothetical protein